MSGPRTKTIWPTIGGVLLEISTPPSDPGGHCWWPLLRAARRAELEGAAPAIRLEEFELVGTRDRRRNLPVWIYLHRATLAELYVTHEGDLFRLQASRSEIGRGRFSACSAAQALVHAGLGQRPSAPILAPAEPVEPPSPEAIERGVRFFRDPAVFPHSRDARRERLLLVSDCYASGRLVRWPLGPGGHRLGDGQPEDRFGRCPDHRCARCYREPAASVVIDRLAALHRIVREPFPPTPDGRAGPPALGLVVDPRPGPSRPRPQPRSPFRPLLRQVWPPPAPASPPSLN